MNKKLTFNMLLLGIFAFLFGACGDDNNNNEVSEEWKQYQQTLVTRISTQKDDAGKLIYQSVQSDSELGYIYYKPSDYITQHQDGNFDTDEPSAFPKPATKTAEAKLTRPEYESDIAVVRYEGWYYNLDEERVVFDGTEIGANNNKKATLSLNGLTDGFKAMLLNMEVGDEYIVCIPHLLAYGTYGRYDDTYGNLVVPGYTTLFFNIKLLEVKRPS